MRMPTMESGRHLLGHAARKRLVVSRREQTGFEPGTIVVVQARDALLHLRRRRERRVLGQVAALGMAAHQGVSGRRESAATAAR